MDFKKQIKIGLGVTVVLFAFAYFISEPHLFGLCEIKYCAEPFDELLGEPLFFFSGITIIFLLLLYFLPSSIFKAWKKFVYWFVPLSVILIAFVPADGSGAFMPGPDREIAIWLFASLYALIGMLLISVKWIAVHKKKNK
jgi:hypothetical protein